MGELSLITGQPRNATMGAAEKSVIFRLDKAGFNRLGDQYPDQMTAFTRTLIPKILRPIFFISTNLSKAGRPEPLHQEIYQKLGVDFERLPVTKMVVEN